MGAGKLSLYASFCPPLPQSAHAHQTRLQSSISSQTAHKRRQIPNARQESPARAAQPPSPLFGIVCPLHPCVGKDDLAFAQRAAVPAAFGCRRRYGGGLGRASLPERLAKISMSAHRFFQWHDIQTRDRASRAHNLPTSFANNVRRSPRFSQQKSLNGFNERGSCCFKTPFWTKQGPSFDNEGPCRCYFDFSCLSRARQASVFNTLAKVPSSDAINTSCTTAAPIKPMRVCNGFVVQASSTSSTS